MTSLQSGWQTTEVAGATDLPAWVLNSSAGLLPKNFLERLGNDLKASEVSLVQELGLNTRVSLPESLLEWSSRPGSTLFVLTGTLSYIGRWDWIRNIKVEMEMHQMTLYVRVLEPGCPDVHHRVITNWEATLSSALENYLGGDLTHFNIVGPSLQVQWYTKAKELKGQQLTLRKYPNPVPHTQAALYGKTSPCTPQYPNTMPPNIPGGDTYQPYKIHEMENLKPPVGYHDSMSTVSDNDLMEGLSELANKGTTELDVRSEKSFETMTLTGNQFSLDENTQKKVPHTKAESRDLGTLPLTQEEQAKALCGAPDDDVMGLSNRIPHVTILNPGETCPTSNFPAKCENILNNVPNLSLLQHSFSSSGTESAMHATSQNDLNCGHSTIFGNDQFHRNCTGEEEVKNLSSKCVLKEVGIPAENFNTMVFSEDDTKKLKFLIFDSPTSLDSFSSFTEVKSPVNQQPLSDHVVEIDESPKHIDVSVVGDTGYISHSQIKRLEMTPEAGANKRNNVPSPCGSPLTTPRSKRHCLATYVQENMELSQHEYNPSSRPQLVHTDTIQLDFENFCPIKSTATSSSTASPLPPAESPVMSPPVVNFTNRPFYVNTPEQNLDSVDKKIELLETKVHHICHDGEEMSETALLCHTPPPSFAESLTRPRSSSEPFVASRMAVNGRQVQSRHIVQYNNTEAFLTDGRIYPGDSTRFVPQTRSLNDHAPSHRLVEDRVNIPISQHEGPRTVIGTERYVQMTRNPDLGIIDASGTQVLSSSLPSSGTRLHLHRQSVPTISTSTTPPLPPDHPPPLRPWPYTQQRGNEMGGIYITTSNQSRSPGGRAQARDSDSCMTEEERYNYIDDAPTLPHRMPNLESQLAQIPGWSPDVHGSLIQQVMKDYLHHDGNYVIWRSRRMNQFCITVSHLGTFVNYCVREQRQGNKTIYYLYDGGFKSESFQELIKHYVECGIKIPVSSGRGPGAKRYMDCIRLRYPLIVKFRSKCLK